MGEMDIRGQVEVVALADPVAGGGPFADPVKRQDSRLVKRRGEEGGRSVRLMMFREEHPALEPGLLLYYLLYPQLLLYPYRHRLDKRP